MDSRGKEPDANSLYFRPTVNKIFLEGYIAAPPEPFKKDRNDKHAGIYKLILVTVWGGTTTTYAHYEYNKVLYWRTSDVDEKKPPILGCGDRVAIVGRLMQRKKYTSRGWEILAGSIELIEKCPSLDSLQQGVNAYLQEKTKREREKVQRKVREKGYNRGQVKARQRAQEIA